MFTQKVYAKSNLDIAAFWHAFSNHFGPSKQQLQHHSAGI
jgi:hypothetical protein